MSREELLFHIVQLLTEIVQSLEIAALNSNDGGDNEIVWCDVLWGSDLTKAVCCTKQPRYRSDYDTRRRRLSLLLLCQPLSALMP